MTKIKTGFKSVIITGVDFAAFNAFFFFFLFGWMFIFSIAIFIVTLRA